MNQSKVISAAAGVIIETVNFWLFVLEVTVNGVAVGVVGVIRILEFSVT